MEFHIWLTLAIAAFVVSLSPGVGAVVSMNYGLKYGLKKSYPAILGLQVGYLIQAFIVVVGLGAIITKSVMVFNIIKWIGVAYLVYFGLSKIFEKVELVDEQEKINSYNPKKAFFSSILINLTNVKATIFLVAFIPQFINPNESIFFQFMILAVTLSVLDIFVMTCYSSLASKLKFLLKDIKAIKIQNRITGGLLILAAILMANTKRA